MAYKFNPFTGNLDVVSIAPPGSDENVKVSSNDTTADYLENKVVSGSNGILISTLNDGGDEDLEVSLDIQNLTGGSIANADIFIFEDANDSFNQKKITFQSLNNSLDHDQLTNYNAAEHFTEASIDHGSISGLADDDHSQYALLAGRSGGQTLIGGTAASNNLTLQSTSNATRGNIIANDTLIPATNFGSDLGTASQRFGDTLVGKIDALGVLSSGGSNYTYNGTRADGSQTIVGINAAGTAPLYRVDNQGVMLGRLVCSNTVNECVMESLSPYTVMVGSGALFTGNATATHLMRAGTTGSVLIGLAYNGFGGAGSDSTMISNGAGALAIGMSHVNTFGGSGTTRLEATANGAIAMGYALTSANVSNLLASAIGSIAIGHVARGEMRSNAVGALTMGYCNGSTNTTRVEATNTGATCFGVQNGGSGNVTASGVGAFVFAYSADSNAVTASGEASLCFGRPSTGVISATALMACQFFEGTNADARTIQVGSNLKLWSTGQIDIGGELNHDGSTLGFYGVTPVARPAAYTQTYATATRTHLNPTSSTLTDSTGGTADTTVAAVSGSGDDANINNNFADLVAQINALRVDLLNAKQVLNQVIDDDQLQGLKQ